MSNLSLVIGIIILTAFITLSGNLQAKKFDEITYEQTLEIKRGSTSKYTTASGEIFSVGQEIFLRSPANGHQNFTYAFTKDSFMVPPFPLSSAWSGQRLKIDKISWKQGQGQPTVGLHTSVENANFGAGKQMIVNLEAAIESRECVISMQSKRPIKEKTPIERLKEAKELLDLEVITQDEYDEVKHQLTPLIMGK